MSNLPWEQYPHIWKTESSWLAYVRGGLRRGLWKNYPPKLEFLNARVELRENTNPRSMKRFPKVKMWHCEQCKNWFTSKDIQVDHRQGNNSLRTIADIGKFVEALLKDCSFEDYATMCSQCHKIKSYAEREGITFEEAQVLKLMIDICKKKNDKTWLLGRGVIPGPNLSKRKEQIENILRQELTK